MRLVSSSVLVGLLAACATAETPNLDGASDPSVLGGSAGSNASAGSDSGGSSGSGQSGAGTIAGSGTAGAFSQGGTFVQGGTFTGGTFTGGTFTGGTSTGGTSTGGTSSAGSATAGTGGGGAGSTGGKAGTGGSGGAPPSGACGQEPLTAKNTWTASANFEVVSACDTSPSSDYCSPVEQGIDGMPDTRFSTGRARVGDEYYQIDFGDTVAVSRVVLSTAAGSGDYTLSYEIRMSNNENDIAGSAIIVMGNGMQGTTTINFPSVKSGRYLRINQTTEMSGWWSLTEVDVSCQ